MRTATVQVPATSANLGPGFDSLGLALGLYNRLTVSIGRESGLVDVTIDGYGIDALPRDDSNLAVRAATHLLRAAGSPERVVMVRLYNEIPMNSGLGGSAATIIGAMVAANMLLDEPLAAEQILTLALDLEAHPDNLAPALHGGFTIAGFAADGAPIVAALPPPPGLAAVVLMPRLSVSTAASRAALPETVPHADAAYNAGRVALLIASLLTGERGNLREAMRDRLHQPYRAASYPAMPTIIEAALAAGACGAALSGSGPAILALCDRKTGSVGQAMLEAARQVDLEASVLDLPLVPHGARVVPGES